MRIAYIFATSGHTVSYKLQQMILPQLLDDRHGANVAGMFFFDDNTYALQEGNNTGERLVRVAKARDILLMLCDQCAFERRLAEVKPQGEQDIGWLGNDHDIGPGRGVRVNGTVDDDFIKVGCFPDLYEALSENPPDNIITL